MRCRYLRDNLVLVQTLGTQAFRRYGRYNLMAALRSLLRRARSAEAGFTIVEAVVAAGILVIDVGLTVTPLVISMRALDRSKDVTIAESLAQARIEQVRALEFDDIGHPGSAPSGILNPVETETVEGANFETVNTVYPNVHDGVEGMLFIEQCVASSKEDGAWLPVRYEKARR